MSSRNGFTYETAQELFAKTTNKEAGKPLENNTRLLQRDEDFVVRLHETDVVTLHPDNTFTLQTGGWQTVTTKDRICRFSPARINAEKGFWWLAISGDWKQKVMFEEGMRVNEEGTPLNAHPWQQESLLKKRKLMRQIVNDYIAGFMQHYAGKGFPMQNEQAFDFSGDCFTCQSMSSKKPAPKDISLGHIVQHMKESYYVPSLFRKAIEWRGYPDPSVIYSWAHG